MERCKAAKATTIEQSKISSPQAKTVKCYRRQGIFAEGPHSVPTSSPSSSAKLGELQTHHLRTCLNGQICGKTHIIINALKERNGGEETGA
eukprot:5588892-Amphidinium_carterae.1